MSKEELLAAIAEYAKWEVSLAFEENPSKAFLARVFSAWDKFETEIDRLYEERFILEGLSK